MSYVGTLVRGWDSDSPASCGARSPLWRSNPIENAQVNSTRDNRCS